MALAGYKASVYATATPSLSFTNESFSSTDNITFSIVNQNKRYWDRSAPLTVQTSPDGTTWTTTTSYTPNYCGGQIVLPAALTGSAPAVRVSGKYLPYSQVGGATSVEVTVSTEIVDVSTLGNLWKDKQANMTDTQIKLTRWYLDSFFLSALTTATRLVVSVYTGANANQRFDGFAYLKTDGIKIAVKNMTEESLDFEVDGQTYSYMS